LDIDIQFKQGAIMRKRRQTVPDPTPEEIAERAAEVRATWTENEEAKRRTGPAPIWAVPVFSVAELGPAASNGSI